MKQEIDAARVLRAADETKRALRQRVTAALDASTGRDAAAATARAALMVLRELDTETVRRAALAFLVRLAADDARFRNGANIGLPKRKRAKSDAPPGGKQNLRKPMPPNTRFAGESFPISCPEQRYQEHMLRLRAERAAAAKTDAGGDDAGA